MSIDPFTIFCVTALVALGFFLRRNSRVLAYRKHILHLIGEASLVDIKHGEKNFFWRYQALDEVSYDEMLWKFWKSFDSFYSDWSFIYPTTTTDEHQQQ